MAIITNVVSVGSDSVALLSTNTDERARFLKNLGNYTIFLGSDSAVTINNGFPIKVGDELDIGDYNGALYAIIDVGDSSTATMQVFEED